MQLLRSISGQQLVSQISAKFVTFTTPGSTGINIRAREALSSALDAKLLATRLLIVIRSQDVSNAEWII